MTKQELQDKLVDARIDRNKALTLLLQSVMGELDRVGKEPTESEVNAVLTKMVKNAEQCGDTAEAAELSKFLPALMSEEEIHTAMAELIIEHDSVNINIGLIMKLWNATYKGKADNKLVSKVARENFL